jgi:hypothetical protein
MKSIQISQIKLINKQKKAAALMITATASHKNGLNKEKSILSQKSKNH